MDTAGYVTLSRQSGLWSEMQMVANNVANISTAGYRSEGLIFAEYVRALEAEGGSVALTDAHARVTLEAQGALTQTGGTYDLAIEGPGYFQVDTPAGVRLTRAGSFTPNADGTLMNPLGYALLDAGGAPVVVPPGAGSVRIAGDGTLSVDGQPLALIGRVAPPEGTAPGREDGVLFDPRGPVEPVDEGNIVQGFLERSNVNPVAEIARMIEVSRAYEASQRLLDRDDERIKQVLDTIGRV